MAEDPLSPSQPPVFLAAEKIEEPSGERVP